MFDQDKVRVIFSKYEQLLGISNPRFSEHDRETADHVEEAKVWRALCRIDDHGYLQRAKDRLNLDHNGMTCFRLSGTRDGYVMDVEVRRTNGGSFEGSLVYNDRKIINFDVV